MKISFKHLSMAFIFFMVICSSAAMANQFDVDPDHSEIRFKVQHIYSTVSGRFTDFDGNIFFNPDALDTAKFDFSVKVKSVDTHNGKRDTHLRSKDFFDEAAFPVMTFKSLKTTRIENNRYALEGLMTLKDVTKKMVVELIYFPEKPHPFDKNKLVAGFVTAFDIQRLEFHVGNGKFHDLGVVGKDVAVEMSFEALRNK